jgi:hypothetical protein
MIEQINPTETAILVGGYVVLHTTSGIVVNYILSEIGEPISRKIGKEARDTGRIYRAVGDIRCKKTIVRRDDMAKNSLFFLAGTMVNVTYSVVVGLIIKLLIC